MSDPLFHDEQRYQKIASDPQIMATMMRSQWIKTAVGLAALLLVAAVWLVWRFG
jgi:hypothetical protein